MIWNPFAKLKPSDTPSTLKLRLRPGKTKPIVLIVLDGFGIAPPSEGNAITQAKTPVIDSFYKNYPHGELLAAGESVGLPANEEGNSEVGHLALGVGKVILQSLKRINVSIEDETFYDNKALIQASNHVKTNNSKLHIMGMVSSGSVHSSMNHFYAMIEFCRRRQISNVYYHLFTDGRDAPPNEGEKIIDEIERKLLDFKIGRIASISGRYYAMDRDRRWQRTQKTYDALVLGKGVQAASALDAVRAAYQKQQTDEFIEPAVIMSNAQPVATIDDNDAVIFFNFRVDRPRQLTMAFVVEDFENLKSFQFGHDPDHASDEGTIISGPTFKRQKVPKNLFFVSMTEYQKGLPVSAIAYPPEAAEVSLPSVLAAKGLKQLHLTESEKERMVTIYFDGLRESRLPGEDVLIVPSPKVATYDKKPEMSVYKVVDELQKALAKDIYHFIVINFANPDMVAHSGNLNATIKAIEHVDKALGVASSAVMAVGGTLLITADHGNAEELLTYPSASFYFTTSKGDMNTDHSANPVPIIIISNTLRGKGRKLDRGTLSDVAPTILSLMGLEIPPQMTGRDLLKLKTESSMGAPPSNLPFSTPSI